MRPYVKKILEYPFNDTITSKMTCLYFNVLILFAVSVNQVRQSFLLLTETKKTLWFCVSCSCGGTETHTHAAGTWMFDDDDV